MNIRAHVDALDEPARPRVQPSSTRSSASGHSTHPPLPLYPSDAPTRQSWLQHSGAPMGTPPRCAGDRSCSRGARRCSEIDGSSRADDSPKYRGARARKPRRCSSLDGRRAAEAHARAARDRNVARLTLPAAWQRCLADTRAAARGCRGGATTQARARQPSAPSPAPPRRRRHAPVERDKGSPVGGALFSWRRPAP